jgi:hypothetical protein
MYSIYSISIIILLLLYIIDYTISLCGTEIKSTKPNDSRG